METIRDCLAYINQQTADDPVNQAIGRRLFFELCQQQQIDMYQNPDSNLGVDFIDDFKSKLQRLLNDEPLGYVLGYEWFFGYKLIVDESVLIPRDETEELVGEVIADVMERYQNKEVVIADIGTGSGAIAIALKKEISNSVVYASDISEAACQTAKKNSLMNEADITFFVGDMAQAIIEHDIKVDVCVCNPPYIKSSEEIQSSVKDHEPHVALFGGTDGLDLYRRLLKQAPTFMKENGMIAFEIGYDQATALSEEIKREFVHATVIVKQDINKLDRMVFVYL